MATKIQIVFYSVCHRATLFHSEGNAIAAAEEESKRRGYQMESVFCDKEHTARVTGDGVRKPGCSVYRPGWHVRAKVFPDMTREQWEQRVAAKRLIEEKEAAEQEVIRLRRDAEQEKKRAEAAWQFAQRLARQKAHATKLAGRKVPRVKYTDGLTTRQRWEKEGRCKRCGKGKNGKIESSVAPVAN